MIKINFLGDSITEGIGASAPDKCFVYKVGELLPCIARNYGIGGTRICPQKKVLNNCEGWNQDFISRVDKMDDDADFVFVFGGTNDYGHGWSPIGDEDDREPTTYYGAIHTLINMLLKKYPKDRICFILPLHRMNEENPYGDGYREWGMPLSRYSSIQKRIVESYGIDTVDFKDELGEPKVYYDFGNFRDGLHPNDEGHLLLAKLVVKYLSLKGIK